MRNIVFILRITNKLIALNKTTTNVNQKHSEWETEYVILLFIINKQRNIYIMLQKFDTKNQNPKTKKYVVQVYLFAYVERQKLGNFKQNN